MKLIIAAVVVVGIVVWWNTGNDLAPDLAYDQDFLSWS